MNLKAWHPLVGTRLRAVALLVLAAAGARAQATQVARISHCAQAPETLRHLEGCWITAGAQGLRAIPQAGNPVPDLPQPGPGQRCTAVAAMPPGEGPCPVSAPLLVAGLAGGAGSARIVALGQDGAHWDWPTDGAGRPDGRSAVRDLALDRDGTIYAVFEDDRDVVRIDLAGNRILHARVPEGAPGAPVSLAPDLPAGLLAMVRDPETGDLYVGDRFGIHRVAPDGGVLTLLAADAPEHRPAGAALEGPNPPLTPCHLALHGRLLLIGDPYRGERFALHLDSRKLGAVLSAAGPLAVSPEGLCLLAEPDGLVTLPLADLGDGVPGTPVSSAPDPPAERDARRRRPPARNPGSSTRPSLKGIALLGLFGMGLLDPSMMQALAQGFVAMPGLSASSLPSFGSDLSSFSPGLSGQLSDTSAQTLAGFDQLESVCGSPSALLLGLQPCAPDYRAGLVAQMEGLDAQVKSLPQIPGPGTCRAGESVAQAEVRNGLEQSGQSARFSLLSAQATAFCSQVERDAFAVIGVGFGLTGGQVLATPFRGNGSLPLTIPALVLGEVGAALTAAGFISAGGGDPYCALGFDLQAAQVEYETLAESQKPDLEATCARTPGNGTGITQNGVDAPPDILVPSPLPALADALDKQTLGCQRATQYGLSLQSCTPLTRQGLARRNATLARLYGQVGTSLAAGASGRGRAIARLRQFAAYANAAAMDVFALGDFTFGAAEVLNIEEVAVAETGDVLAGSASMASSYFLFGVANLVWSDGYDLERIAALASGQVAVLTLEGYAGRLALLDQQEALAPSGTAASSTGSSAQVGGERAGGSGNVTTGPSNPDSSTSGRNDTPGPDGGAGRVVPLSPAPVSSAGYRVRPLLCWRRILFWWWGPNG